MSETTNEIVPASDGALQLGGPRRRGRRHS